MCLVINPFYQYFLSGWLPKRAIFLWPTWPLNLRNWVKFQNVQQSPNFIRLPETFVLTWSVLRNPRWRPRWPPYTLYSYSSKTVCLRIFTFCKQTMKQLIIYLIIWFCSLKLCITLTCGRSRSRASQGQIQKKMSFFLLSSPNECLCLENVLQCSLNWI